MPLTLKFGPLEVLARCCVSLIGDTLLSFSYVRNAVVEKVRVADERTLEPATALRPVASLSDIFDFD